MRFREKLFDIRVKDMIGIGIDATQIGTERWQPIVAPNLVERPAMQSERQGASNSKYNLGEPVRNDSG